MKKHTTIWLVAKREIRERTRSKTFKIGTLITVLIVCAGIVVPVLTADNSKPMYKVGIVKPAPAELQQSILGLQQPLGIDITIEQFNDRENANTALQNKMADMIVVPSKEIVTRVAIDPAVDSGIGRLGSSINEIARLYAGLEQAGLSGPQASTVLNARPLPMRGLEPAPQRNNNDASGAAGSMILLFVFLTLYGAWILNGVVEEKTSRVVEVLLSTVRTDELLMGKVLGIGVVGSIQGAVLVIATFAARQGVGTSDTRLSAAVIGYTFLWFVLGFAMYAWAYACAGALVSRAEDAQNLVFPLQMPLLASYVVGLVSSVSGPNTALTVMSMIPFTAPMTMLERMAAGQVPLWQVLFSISLCVITAFVVMRVAITVFSGGILRSGRRVKLKDAWLGSRA